MKRILVCGGRDFGLTKDERNFIFSQLDKFCWDRGYKTPEIDNNWLPDVLVISGLAKGVDTVAIDWAVVNWLQSEEYPADWDKYGRRAGPLRNIQMLEEGKPDYVLAFPGGRGTEHMKRIAREAGVEVIEFELA